MCSIVYDENIYLDKTTLITITTDIWGSIFNHFMYDKYSELDRRTF